MLLDAKEKYGLDIRSCYFVGDRWKDIKAGEIMGCKTIFIDYDYDEIKPKLYSYKFKNIFLMINNIQKIL